ncbi:MAG: cupin domain-containing protein [Halothece sp.]
MVETIQTQDITIERQPSQERLNELGVFNWPVWSKEASQFPWTYDEPETCYFVAGKVTVTPDGGDPVEVGQGDLVTFPAGMSCTWKIHSDVKKHYQLG